MAQLFYLKEQSHMARALLHFFKKINDLKSAWLPQHFKLYEMKVASLFNTWLVPGREKPLQRFLKTSQNCLCYHLPWSLKIFIKVFAFLTEKANANEIGGWISFPNFLRKMLTYCIIFLRFKAKNQNFFFRGSVEPLQRSTSFPRSPNLAQRPL